MQGQVLPQLFKNSSFSIILAHLRHWAFDSSLPTSCSVTVACPSFLRHPSVICFGILIPNRTQGKPLSEFAPLYRDSPSDPQIVDFLITLNPSPAIAQQVWHLLRDIPEEELRTINQTFHTRYEPAVMSIETKRGHNDD